MWAARYLLLVCLAVAVCVVCVAPARAAQEWRVGTLASSTVAPGGSYEVMIELSNSGDTAMDGSENQVLARLPVGMTAGEASITTAPGFDFIGSARTAGDGVSPVAGASDVRCTNFDPISPGLGGGGYRFHLMRLTVGVGAGGGGGAGVGAAVIASGGGGGEVSAGGTGRGSA